MSGGRSLDGPKLVGRRLSNRTCKVLKVKMLCLMRDGDTPRVTPPFLRHLGFISSERPKSAPGSFTTGGGHFVGGS